MTPDQAMDTGSKMIHLLTQQRLLYIQLRDLASRQSTLVDGKDPETLLRILAGRQRLIDRLAGLDRELRPVRADWQKIAEMLPPQQRQQAQELVQNVQNILGEIIVRDERDSETLSQQRQEVAKEICNVNAGKRVNRAYGGPQYTPGRSLGHA